MPAVVEQFGLNVTGPFEYFPNAARGTKLILSTPKHQHGLLQLADLFTQVWNGHCRQYVAVLRLQGGPAFVYEFLGQLFPPYKLIKSEA